MVVKHGMCGNGIRCLAKYLYIKKLITNNKFLIETLSGIKEVELIIENQSVIGIKVDMGEIISDKEVLKIDISNVNFKGYKVFVGNPHFVCFVDELSVDKIEKYGPIIENYKYFPDKTNVEFVKKLSSNRIKMLVWERGVGRTLACGTGACAASLASYLYQSTKSELTVELEGGILKTIYNKENKRITLIGNSEVVFNGVLDF